jgi:epoxyqueuosine reductase
MAGMSQANEPQTKTQEKVDYAMLAMAIKAWGRELGFGAVGIADCDLAVAEKRLAEWLAKGFHGEMDYMARHGTRRSRPGELVPGTLRVIAVRLDYQVEGAEAWGVINDPRKAYVARYALGRDYHKVLRARLQSLAERMQAEAGAVGHRVFVDSAPVMEVELATRAGLGWRGKHTLLLSREAGSLFFLGEIYTDLPLPVDAPLEEHCGSCRKCIDVCPTQAIVAPRELDARRCISYLTIELKGPIPVELRPLIGNRVYGCDDCQLVCPWNKYAQLSAEPDFRVRHGLDDAELVDLFAWTEAEFLDRMAGSAIHRIGYERWSRNLAVGLGNALAAANADVVFQVRALAALQARAQDASELVREHVHWALGRQSAADGGLHPA